MSDMKNHPVTSLTYPLKASSHRKIAVIGGGIAGIQAVGRGDELVLGQAGDIPAGIVMGSVGNAQFFGVFNELIPREVVP